MAILFLLNNLLAQTFPFGPLLEQLAICNMENLDHGPCHLFACWSDALIFAQVGTTPGSANNNSALC
jgi:hypothetical protein